ncbi:MAG: hypothetical protein ACTSSD_19600, partial [Candidatus Thorarchaeota archaeon]
MELDEVRFGTYNGENGVFIGHQTLFTHVRYDVAHGLINARIRDLRTPPIRACAWVTVNRPDQLLTHQRASPLRRTLRDEWRENDEWRQALDYLVMVVQDNLNEFYIEQEEETEEEPQTGIPLSEDELVEVENILNSHDIMTQIKQKLDDIIAGEDENKQIVFLLLLSGLIPDNDMKQMILIKGTSGSGKSTLMGLADLFNTKDVGRFTAHALDHTEDLAEYEVLRLKELGLMDKEEGDISTIKFLSNDDNGYNVDVTVRDPSTGRFTTEQKHIDPITIISSTTRVDIDEQYERRNWIISPDETKEQTERIRIATADNESEKDIVTLGILPETTKRQSKRILKAIVQRLPICDVIIPFNHSLTKILESNTLQNNLRVRGDFGRIIDLVKLYGILNQRSLPRIPSPTGDVAIMTPEKAYEVIELALRPLTTMTSEIERRCKKILDALWDMGIKERQSAIDLKTSDEIAHKIGLCPTTARRYLRQLGNKGYLSDDGKTPKTYFLQHDIYEILRRFSAVSNILENPNSLICDMWCETLEFFGLIANANNVTEAEEEREYDEEEVDENLSPEERRVRRLSRRMDVPQAVADAITEILPLLEEMYEQYQLISPTENAPMIEPESVSFRQSDLLLSEKMDSILTFLQNEYYHREGAVTTREIVDSVSLSFGVSISVGEVQRLLELLVRDGKVMQVRPDHWK